MGQQGQVFELRRTGRDGEWLWAYRYRVAGRGSRRSQRGGFATQADAAAALERELECVRRERRVSRSLTLAELVEVYLAQHDVAPVTVEKLRWLLGKAIVVFGGRRVGELTSVEIAAWRMTLPPVSLLESLASSVRPSALPQMPMERAQPGWTRTRRVFVLCGVS
jgi:hypothetical protein